MSSNSVYLNAAETFAANQDDTFIYGSGSVEAVVIAHSVSGLVLDQNIEQIFLPGTYGSYHYQQSGNQLLVYVGEKLCCQIAIQEDSDGTQFFFSDGLVNGKISAGGQIVGETGYSTTPSQGSLVQRAAALSYIDADVGRFLGSNDRQVMPLLSGDQWNKSALTYGFNSSIPAEYYGVNATDSTVSGNLTTGWSALNSTEKKAVKEVMAGLSNLVALSLTERSVEESSSADIRFNVVPMPTAVAGFAYFPPNSTRATEDYLSGDVFLAANNRMTDQYLAGDQGYKTIVHELGHALGLKHPFEAPSILTKSLDNTAYTVMSYTAARNQTLHFSYENHTMKMAGEYAGPSSYGVLDVAALQALYGANLVYHTGFDRYTVSTTKHQYVTIWDAGGTDILDASDASGSCVIDLRAGSLSSVDIHTVAEQQAQTQAYYRALGVNGDAWVANIYSQNSSKIYTGENNFGIAYGVWIENVNTGSAADTVRDNAVNNVIKTGAGNDLIELYEGGLDTVDAGAGFDVVKVTNNRSQAQLEKQADGSYWLLGTYFAAQLIGVEQVQFSDVSISLA